MTQIDYTPNEIRPTFLALRPLGASAYLALILLPTIIWVITSSLNSGMTPDAEYKQVIDDIHRALATSDPPSPGVTGWPAWRDIRSTTILLVMAATPLLASIQWSGYERLNSHMTSQSSLRFASAAEKSVTEGEIALTNRWIKRARWARIPIFAAALTVAYALLQSQRLSYGVDDRQPSQWWVSTVWVSECVYLIVAAVGIYTVTIQNVVGCRIILATWRTRNNATYGADMLNLDKSWGWSAARTILGATYLEILLHGVALVAILIAIPHDGLAYFLASIPAVEWMVTLPIYLAVPLLVISGAIKKFRAHELATLSDTSRGTANYSIPKATRSDRINSVPRIPFFRPWTAFLYFVANVANIATFLSLFNAIKLG